MGHCQPSVLLASQPFANAMILRGDKLYIGTNANKLVVVSTDGTGVKDLAADNSQFAPLALDATYAYWVASTGTNLRIARAPLAGGGVIDTVATLPVGTSPNSLAVDASGVYFADSVANNVEEYNFAMSKLQDVATSQSFAGQTLIIGSDLFWTTNSPASLTKKGLPSGSPAVLCAKSAAGQLIASSKDLFFNGEMGLSTIPINGANPQMCPTVLTSNTGTALATDGVTLYWSDNVDATIKSVPVAGGPVTTVGTTFGYTIGLAVDDKYLYWQVKTGLDIVRLEKNP
jgi:hypothetical protein